MFYIISKLFDFFTSPINWIFALLVAGNFVQSRRTRKKILYGALFLALIFTNGPLSGFALNKWSKAYNNPMPEFMVYDMAIVMGGSVGYSPESGQIDYNEKADRITEAIRLYRSGKIKKLYLLGESAFNYRKGVTYAPQFLSYMKEMGVNPGDIILEQNSRTTRENIINVKAILEKKSTGNTSILLITSGIHMRRALKGFENSGINLTPYAVEVPGFSPPQAWDDFLPSWKAAQQWQSLFHEMIGLLVI